MKQNPAKQITPIRLLVYTNALGTFRIIPARYLGQVIVYAHAENIILVLDKELELHPNQPLSSYKELIFASFALYTWMTKESFPGSEQYWNNLFSSKVKLITTAST